MKSLLGLIIWVCVGVGAVSAVAAYFVPTTLDAEAYRSSDEAKKGPSGYAVLASPAGPDVPRDGAEAPMYPAGTELTPEVTAAMAAVQGDGEPLVKRVHLAEFGFARWSHKWYFLGSVVLLALCGIAQKVLSGNGQLKKGAADPVDSLAASLDEVKSVHDDVLAMQSDKARMAEIIERIGELQQTHLANFPEARDVMVARGGLAKYANVMDAFAGAERKINRAWSAAADGDLGESIENLELAVPLLEETAKRLR
jgi:hypothetical protein